MRVTAARITRDLAWFRILFTTRKQAHYLGRLRWKVLRP